jgi:hypothetical protein
MSKQRKRPRGRPAKDEADKWAEPSPLRLDKEMLAAVEAYQAREGFATRSEAMRRLIRIGLKAENLM